MSERLTTTIKHLQDGVEKMGLAAARHSIESWQTELKNHDEKLFQTIAADLEHLHAELGNDSPDATKVRKLMGKLGKETVRCAKQGGDKTDLVTQLGNVLEKAAAQEAAVAK